MWAVIGVAIGAALDDFAMGVGIGLALAIAWDSYSGPQSDALGCRIA